VRILPAFENISCQSTLKERNGVLASVLLYFPTHEVALFRLLGSKMSSLNNRRGLISGKRYFSLTPFKII
jgi:hypothetical protein